MLDPKRIVKAVLILAACILTTAYMYHQVIGTKKNVLETQTALAISLENTVDATAYIVRNERVLPASSTGTVFAVVDDGEKISGNMAVANIYINESDAGSKTRIDEIDEQLEILNSSTVDQEYFSADVVKLEDDKNEILSNIIRNKAKNKFSLCIGKKNSLLISMNKLSTVKNGTSFESQIKALEAEKSSLSAKTGETYTKVYTPVSGYYYGITDGYENIFTVEALEKMTISDFDKMISAQPDEQIIGGSAGKTVTQSRWYLMCQLDKSNTAGFVTGKNYTVTFPYSSNTAVTMELDRIISETDKKSVVLVFSTDFMPESFDYTRTQKIEIVSESYSGLKIPKAAMRMLPDGTKGVYVLVGETVRFRRAEEIYQFDDSYIIREESDEEKQKKAAEQNTEAQDTTVSETVSATTDNTVENDTPIESDDVQNYPYLSLYDSVIVSGKDLYDGKRIN